MSDVVLKQFIKKLNIQYKYKYDYSKVIFINSKIPVEIVCPLHGSFFKSFSMHRRGVGCLECSIENKTKLLSSTKEYFVEKANIIHKNFYSYEKFVYTKSTIKGIIICPIHGDFEQKANDHLNGKGCRKCGYLKNNVGWSRSDFERLCLKNNGNGIFYVIRCFNDTEEFYKIGITSQTIEKRYRGKLPYNYEIIQQVDGPSSLVYDLEKLMLKTYKNNYTPLIPFKGSVRECFK